MSNYVNIAKISDTGTLHIYIYIYIYAINWTFKDLYLQLQE